MKTMTFREFFSYLLATTQDDLGRIDSFMKTDTDYYLSGVKTDEAEITLYRDQDRCFAMLRRENDERFIRVIGRITRNENGIGTAPNVVLCGIESGERVEDGEIIHHVFAARGFEDEKQLMGDYRAANVYDANAKRHTLSELRLEATAAAIDYGARRIVKKQAMNLRAISYLFESGDVHHLPHAGSTSTHSDNLCRLRPRKKRHKPAPGC